MGKGTGDRTELEMALVKLCSPELDVTNESVAARLTALERAVKKGISVQTRSELPVGENEPAEEKPEPAKEIFEQKPEEKPEIKPEPKPEPKPEVKAEKTAPKTQSGSVDIVKLSLEAAPFPQWVEVVEALKSTSRSIAAAFSGSSAYENGAYLLIDSKNSMAFELLKKGDMRKKVRDILLQITGKPYKLGPYKTETQKEAEQSDPLNSFKEKLRDSGVNYTEE